MTTTWQQNNRTTNYGQDTTVELTKRQEYSISTATTRKRPHEQIDNGQPQHHLPTRSRQPSNQQFALIKSVKPRLNASLITSTGTNVQNSPEPPHNWGPGPSQNPLLSLSHPVYGLPQKLVSNLRALGICSIYPWQASCLAQKKILLGDCNFIYTAPTGGGKSLVADVLMLKRIIENPGKKAILVLPYVALVQEKLKWLRRVVEGVSKCTDTEHETLVQKKPFGQGDSSIRVAAFFGGNKTRLSWPDFDIAICTIEKANALVNSSLEDGKIGELVVVVVDELHMIDDEHRGYILELMLTKLLCVDHGSQIVGMSATLSNPQLVAQWLRANFYIANHRPIPIEEHLVYDNYIYPTASSKDFSRTASQLSLPSSTPRPPHAKRTILKSSHQELKQPALNAVVALAVETATAGHGALVFCSSRIGAQSVASLISDAMPADTTSAELFDRRMDVLAALQALSAGFESTFSKTILCGVGFHHAGLTVEEREIVAGAYDSGILKVMVATCSLAAGINLPARRVILHGARMGRELVGPAMLRQMRGRAGRKGKDETGETYLCCQKEDLQAVAELLEAELPPVESCLTPEKRGVKRALLEIIVTGLANTRATLNDYVERSLLWETMEHSLVLQMVDQALASLMDDNLVSQSQHGSYEPTRIGSAIVASALSPEDGICVHADLERAQQSFVMDGEMHIFYLFTPLTSTSLFEITWPIFRDQLETLDDSGLRALRLVGVNPATVNRLVNSGASLPIETSDEIELARIYRRAYTSFQLRDLCNEVPVHNVSLKYGVPRGAVQNLQQTCQGFAAGMIKFCERMGWGMLGAVLDHMQDRLRAGARADLLELAKVTYVKSRMARILWENGFKTVKALAEADTKDLLPVMMQAQSHKLRLHGEARVKLEEKLKTKAEVIVKSAMRVYERQMLLDLEEY